MSAIFTPSAWSTPLRYSKWRMGGSVQKRMEKERFLATLGRGRRPVIDAGRRRENRRALAGRRLRIGIHCRRRGAGQWLRRRLRRQVETALAAAAGERQRGGSQN